MARPSTYQDTYPELILDLMSKGALNCDLFSALNISKAGFYKWLHEHKDFGDAYQIGRPKAEAFWANQLKIKTLAGDDKGVKACIMILNNNFSWGRDENRPGSNSVTNNIQIQQMNVMQNKSTQELLEIIKSKEQYLLEAGVIDAEVSPIEHGTESRTDE